MVREITFVYICIKKNFVVSVKQIVLTKNFYNKEYLPTTRISNYYLYN